MFNPKAKITQFVSQYKEADAAFYKDTIKVMRAQFAEIDQISDAGQKYMALEAFKAAHAVTQEEAHQRVVKQMSPLFKKGRNMSFLASVATGGGVAVFAGPLAGFLSGFLLMCSSTFLAEHFHSVFRREYSPARDSFISDMESILNSAKEKQNSIISDDMQGLGASPLFDEVYNKFPDVRDAFVREAAKEKAVASIGSTLTPLQIKKEF